MLAERADAGEDGELSVPPTIRALLAARVDRLPWPQRQVIQAASIEGWVFRRSAVVALLGPAGRDGLAAHLMDLIRKEFIRPDRTTSTSDDAFRFSHVLVRDAAYEALSKADRAALHERYADWSESVAAAPDDVAEVVAYHVERAYEYRRELGSPDPQTDALALRAGRAFGQAGRRMNERGDAAAASALLARAIPLLEPHPATRLDLLPDLGLAMTENGDLAGAERLLTEGAAEARRLGDEPNELRIEMELWRVVNLLVGVEADGPRATARRAIERVRATRRPSRTVGGMVPAGGAFDRLDRANRRIRARTRLRVGGCRRSADDRHLERIRRRHALRSDPVP